MMAALPLWMLAACAPDEVREGPKPPPAAAEWAPADPGDHDFTAKPFPGGLEVFDDGKLVSRIRSGKPLIERWAFVKEGKQMVVRSSGAEGPVMIELFDSRTAVRRAAIAADEVIDGRPAWAAGFTSPAY